MPPITANMLDSHHKSGSGKTNHCGIQRIKEILCGITAPNNKFIDISIFNYDHYKENTKVTIRARIHRIRIQAKIIFIVLKQGTNTIQCIFIKKDHPKEIVDDICSLTRESIIDIKATVKKATPIVKSCTVQNLELEIISINVISASRSILPIEVDEHIYLSEKTKMDDIEKESKLVTRLNNRVLDLRKEDNKLIFKIQSDVSKIIRNYLDFKNFIEIHSPKLISTASEGGSNVFSVNYFNQNAYLAQSPQLYKQMAICADFSRVYEIGPVFRAEKSFTHRHLTEFTGIDLEMVFNEDYGEILDFFNGLFINLFQELQLQHGLKINKFNEEFGIEPFEFAIPSVKIKFADAVQLLREVGFEMDDYEDFNTEKEKALGKIIKEKYHTDFFMVDQFPTIIRPFYTMPNNDNPMYSNSYDFFIRGEEILSGAQRINDYDMLVESAKRNKIDTSKIIDYLESFKYGTPLHGGGGIGLERVVMLYLGINNIRNVSMFPRDPIRLTP